MVHRHAHDRQPDRDVHAVVTVHGLKGCVTLVVVANHGEVVLTANGRGNQSVAGQGANDVESTSPGLGDGRCQNVGIFISKESIFARMRVKAGESNQLIGLTHGFSEGASQF